MNKFKVVVCCQGHPHIIKCKNLISALFVYAYEYLKYKKYGTMNFELKEIFYDYQEDKK